eukprot:TRINITY_DN710_c0_g1_i1.p1 TRINITY_DN710_c0_g1~~TRINITY_DN710_c0_g1_i1.p1  ORF type:complete len:322 (+),score=121.11 TRINITY_DN710_c0_g1_i1:101-1066(+)
MQFVRSCRNGKEGRRVMNQVRAFTTAQSSASSSSSSSSSSRQLVYGVSSLTTPKCITMVNGNSSRSLHVLKPLQCSETTAFLNSPPKKQLSGLSIFSQPTTGFQSNTRSVYTCTRVLMLPDDDKDKEEKSKGDQARAVWIDSEGKQSTFTIDDEGKMSEEEKGKNAQQNAQLNMIMNMLGSLPLGEQEKKQMEQIAKTMVGMDVDQMMHNLGLNLDGSKRGPASSHPNEKEDVAGQMDLDEIIEDIEAEFVEKETEGGKESKKKTKKRSGTNKKAKAKGEVEGKKQFGKDMKPSEVVTELDKHIVGQKEAKRAVAIALRNR